MALEKTLGVTVVMPVVRWPRETRLSAADKAAMDAYTREVQKAMHQLVDAVQELQRRLKDSALD